jgi:hypothetical protein
MPRVLRLLLKTDGTNLKRKGVQATEPALPFLFSGQEVENPAKPDAAVFPDRFFCCIHEAGIFSRVFSRNRQRAT